MNTDDFVEWDGKAPIAYIGNGKEKILFSPEELSEWLAEDNTNYESATLYICEPNTAPEFDVINHVYDCLPDDKDTIDLDGAEEINKIVNDWIKSKGVLSWSSTLSRPSIESLKKFL